MEHKLYNVITTVCLIVAALSTFLYSSAPVPALSLGAIAGIVSTAVYFINRAYEPDSALEKKESEPVVPKIRSASVEATNAAPNFLRHAVRSDEVFSEAVLDAVKVMTETVKGWEIHHRQTPAWSFKRTSPSDPMKYKPLLHYMHQSMEGLSDITIHIHCPECERESFKGKLGDFHKGKFSSSLWGLEEDEPKNETSEEFPFFAQRRKALSQ